MNSYNTPNFPVLLSPPIIPAGLVRVLPSSAEFCQAWQSLVGLGQSLTGFLLN